MHTTRPSLYCRFRFADNLKLSILLWFTKMPKREFRQASARLAYSSGREPATAAMLSVIPGLGQFYNGQSVKGFLFMDVAAVNAVLLTVVLFAEPMSAGLRSILTGNHVKPNDGILQALASAHLGTPFSMVLLSMILLFVGFAVRDAYDFARGERLKPIYADSALHLSEAASGSYLFHFAAMISCAVFALLFLIPRPEVQQVTEIEFTQTPVKDVAPVKPKKFSTVESSAKHRDKAVEKPTPATSTASQARTQQTHEKAQTPPRQAAATKPIAAKEPPAKGEPAPAVRPVHVANPAPAVQPVPTVRPAPSVRPANPAVNPNPIPTPMTMAPKPVAATSAANVAPAPTLTRAATTPAPNSLLAMLPQSLPGSGPVPMALTRSASSSTSGPMPAEAKRNSASNTAGGGPPAPMNVASGNSPTGTPTPITGAHGASQNHSTSNQVSSPTKIASILPGSGTGLVHPVLGSGGPSSVPRVDSKGDDTESGRGKNGQETGKADFSAYMAELQRRIKRNWTPPKDRNSRQVVVEFTISRSGELGSVRLARSSGMSLNDQAAMNAIRAAAPYAPLPKFADESVDIQFTFDYHVFGGQASF